MEAIKLKQKTNRRGNAKAYFQRLMMLMAAIMVSMALAGCDIVNDDENPATKGDDAVSVKALIGGWSNTTYSANWIFTDKGKFGAAFFLRSSSSAFQAQIRGEYKVSGGVIKFTKCYLSSALAFEEVKWGDYKDAWRKLIETPLPEAKKVDDFSSEFEFFDIALLRLRYDQTVIGSDDQDFKRTSDPVSVPIPTHRIAPAKWPSNLLSPDMPAYTGDRIRQVDQSTVDTETAPEYRYVWITIDRASADAFLAYTAKLRTAGWSGPDNEEIRKELNKVDPASILYNSYNVHFRKGCYYLIFTAYPGKNFKFEISSKREIEGIWPSALFGDEFRPPSGAVLIGEIKASELLYDNGDMSLYTKIDFWPGTPGDYSNTLKSKGFVSAIYADHVKQMRINGKMYEVAIDVTPIPDTKMATVFYRLWYRP